VTDWENPRIDTYPCRGIALDVGEAALRIRSLTTALTSSARPNLGGKVMAKRRWKFREQNP
jgi:hypothetical protein